MAAKPALLRDLNNLPEADLKVVASLVSELKKCRDKKTPAIANAKVVAGKQMAAIKKWAGRKLSDGFCGRDHDAVLYGDSSS